jgi:hypothetical protein
MRFANVNLVHVPAWNAASSVDVTELSQTARGAAASLPSCFFDLGQPNGPITPMAGLSRRCSRALPW